MGNSISYLVTLAVGVFIGILLTNQCNPSHPREVVLHDTIPGDSIPYTVYQDKPVIEYRDRWNTDSFPYPVFDTIEVIGEYFATNHYSDTLKDDTSAFIAYSATVFRNEIRDLKLDFQNKRVTAINHIYPEKQNRVLIGAGATLRGFDVQLGYMRKENALSITYGTQGVGLRYNRVLASW